MAETVGRLLYFSPTARGGLADYARYQANALAQLGLTVDFLTTSGFAGDPNDSFVRVPLLSAPRAGWRGPVGRIQRALTLLAQYRQLARFIEHEEYRHVLLGAFAEYLAPIWALRLQRLSRRGTVFGAVIHDPVRDFVVGPHWWHQRSIAAAYSFLREAFVHEPIVLDTGRSRRTMRPTVIPHGIYTFPPATLPRAECRRKLEIPDAAHVWLSFGHVRDGKNLDLAIRALAHFPDAILLVAGKEQSAGQKSLSFYRDVAQQCGVADRCRWRNDFIPAEEVGNIFSAADVVLLTYQGTFRSASGVLNAAVHFRKPCLASSGQGNLQQVVSTYDLGCWVEPDSLPSMLTGMLQLRQSPPCPRWDVYAADNSWHNNATIVAHRLFAPHDL